MPRNDPAVRNGRFLGLDEVSPSEQVSLDGLTVATNVDIDRNLKVKRRPGYSSVYSGTVHALWGDGEHLFLAADGDIRSLAEGAVGSYGVTPTYLHGVSTPQGVVLTSGEEVWLKQPNQSLVSYGLTVPAAPSVTRLPNAGKFKGCNLRMAATAFEPGRGESGASPIVTVQVEDGDGLLIFLPSSSHKEVRLYLSSSAGTELYYEPTESNVLTVRLAETKIGRNILSTAFSGLPVGPARTVGVHRGRLLYAEHNVLWYSEAFAYERFKLTDNFISFEAPINLIAPVADGVFVGTSEAHYFLAGQNIAESRLVDLTSYGAALGQPVLVNEHEHNFEGVTDHMLVWLSTRGLVGGFEGGNLLNLSENKVRFGQAQQGSVGMRRGPDLNQVICCARS